MSESWTSMSQVPQQQLQDRLQSVKTLAGDERAAELYEIVKDADTGDHYLHYAYMHLTVADGEEQTYHQLLPLDSDNVLGILFGGQPYAYPDHWRSPYLRNGPDGTYVWFDPSQSFEGAAEGQEKLAREVVGMLGEWKRRGTYDSESVKRLLEQIDRTMERDEER
ncbi:hypothetical protein ACFFNY_27070 [Paenibacillus hodogayensis]|uniref:Uncharacterized protein n=1 Tax=Paenibacillus hodogayensis TaxID=279208 RepID=A0ABV5W3U1_9BACL